MNLNDMILRIQSNTNDKSGSIFTEGDMTAYINEGIDRLASNPYLVNEAYLSSKEESPILLPRQYHHLLVLYSTSRCFAQDERNYASVSYMNEFENKFDELIKAIDAGEVVIKDAGGVAVIPVYEDDFVVHTYFDYYAGIDLDDGVEGVE